MEETNATACRALVQISEDFHETFREHCARCHGTGTACLVERIFAAMWQQLEAPVTDAARAHRD